MNKKPISAQELLIDSFELGSIIYQSGLKPDLILGVWRGGAPIAICIHEYFKYMGCEIDHFPIRALSYTGINEHSEKVKVDGLEYMLNNREKYNQILIIDDVFDTGNSFQTIINIISEINTQIDIKIAAPWFKPKNNQTNLLPDFFVHETEQWLIFPHELDGLSLSELSKFKPEIYKFIKQG